MNWNTTLLIVGCLVCVQVVVIVTGLVRKRLGKGHFTWRDGLSGLAAFVVAGLAMGFFMPDIMAVSSGPRMTDGMLALVGIVVYVGVRFILQRLWK